MKIILSPSKTQDKSHMTHKKIDNVINISKSKDLFNILKNYSKDQIKDLMKIKNKTLDETYDIYQEGLSDPMVKKAIKLYQGVAFEQIKLDDYNQEQVQYLNNHLIILSAMYGPLKPNSYIKAYRLDMTMKPDDMNLYDYWQDDTNAFFKDEDIIINLASNEFSKMLKPLKDKLLTIDFKEEKNGQLKTISYNAKKARGQMVHQLVLNRIIDTESIKSLKVNDYHYDDNYSSHNHYIFVKKHQ